MVRLLFYYMIINRLSRVALIWTRLSGLLSSLSALDSRCLTFEYLPFPFAAHAPLDVSITLAGFCYLFTMVGSSASLRFERQFPPSQQRWQKPHIPLLTLHILHSKNITSTLNVVVETTRRTLVHMFSTVQCKLLKCESCESIVENQTHSHRRRTKPGQTRTRSTRCVLY